MTIWYVNRQKPTSENNLQLPSSGYFVPPWDSYLAAKTGEAIEFQIPFWIYPNQKLNNVTVGNLRLPNSQFRVSSRLFEVKNQKNLSQGDLSFQIKFSKEGVYKLNKINLQFDNDKHYHEVPIGSFVFDIRKNNGDELISKGGAVLDQYEISEYNGMYAATIKNSSDHPVTVNKVYFNLQTRISKIAYFSQAGNYDIAGPWKSESQLKVEIKPGETKTIRIDFAYPPTSEAKFIQIKPGFSYNAHETEKVFYGNSSIISPVLTNQQFTEMSRKYFVPVEFTR